MAWLELGDRWLLLLLGLAQDGLLDEGICLLLALTDATADTTTETSSKTTADTTDAST